MENKGPEDSRLRRSSRLSGSGSAGKRKRAYSDDADSAPKPKMTKDSEKQLVDFTFADLTKFMNGEFCDSINKDMERNNKELSKRIDQTQAELQTHKKQVQRELAKMRAELKSPAEAPETDSRVSISGESYAKAAAAPAARAPTSGKNRDVEKQYWRSRRSSRFFPVEGVKDRELRASLSDFFENKLRIPAGDISCKDVEQVRRVRMRRGKDSQLEVIVLFVDIEARDLVASYAQNLAQFIDQAGKPTAGVRFDVPDHLSGVHRTLLQYGHAMWIKYNKDPAFKRNIRFDDVEMSFCLDIKFPGKEKWVTASYERAMIDKRANAAVDLDQDELLSTKGPPLAFSYDGEMDEADPQAGTSGARGSVTCTSWRAPRKQDNLLIKTGCGVHGEKKKEFYYGDSNEFLCSDELSNNDDYDRKLDGFCFKNIARTGETRENNINKYILNNPEYVCDKNNYNEERTQTDGKDREEEVLHDILPLGELSEEDRLLTQKHLKTDNNSERENDICAGDFLREDSSVSSSSLILSSLDEASTSSVTEQYNCQLNVRQDTLRFACTV